MTLLLSILFLFLGHSLRAIRFHTIARLRLHFHPKDLLNNLSITYIINFFIPFRLIGELFRIIHLYAINQYKQLSAIIVSIIIDRILDVLAVSVLFISLYYFAPIYSTDLSSSTQNSTQGTIASSQETITANQENAASRERFALNQESVGANQETISSITSRESMYYNLRLYLILLLLITLSPLNYYFKKYIRYTISFLAEQLSEKNSQIFYDFSWEFINMIKFFIKNTPKFSILIYTAFMWIFYITSFYLFNLALQNNNLSLIDIFNIFFSSQNIFQSTYSTLQLVSIKLFYYTLSPILGMLLIGNVIFKYYPEIERKITYLFKPYSNKTTSTPFENPKDALNFFRNYFKNNNQNLLLFLSINNDITIISDLNGGSNAKTLLVNKNNSYFIRKFISGNEKEIERFKNQLLWLIKYSDSIPLAKVINYHFGLNYAFYDMEYYPEAMNFIDYIHTTNPLNAFKIISCVQDFLNNNLYNQEEKGDEFLIKKYIQEKFIHNIDLIMNSPLLSPLTQSYQIEINGKQYKNLLFFRDRLSLTLLMEVFSKDPKNFIHGDLTLENIIYSKNYPQSFYIIDPNSDSIHNTKYQDYAKTLQSLYYGYEFISFSKIQLISNNKYNYVFHISSEYKELLQMFNEKVYKSFSNEEIRSIHYHLIGHILRFLPYKIKKQSPYLNEYYFRFIIILNEIMDLYEK